MTVGKQGLVEKALELFHQMEKNGTKAEVIAWTGLLSAYANSGLIEQAFECFNRMQLSGVEPDVGTWTTLVGACAKRKQIVQLSQFFQRLERQHKLKPAGVPWVYIVLLFCLFCSKIIWNINWALLST